ncbi:hypothetical protein AX16_010579 [Volvariella volvacea WC 439]|nr:hypothetical protein AX16_010579 [Volvariella volvacea WC 439]
MPENDQQRSRPHPLTGLAKHPGSTPIPPSLQPKMAALANRNARQQQDLESVANAFNRMTFGDSTFSHPALAAAHPSHPPARPPPFNRRRPNLNLGQIDPSLITSNNDNPISSGAGLALGRPPLGVDPPRRRQIDFVSPFSNYKKIVDPSGILNFQGKAVLHSTGVNFSNGASFDINMDQLQLDEELGKGNYGTVKKVLHKPTNVAMAMKEIRLELDEAKLKAIVMELDVLHRAVGPQIVDFYGAFFIESCVYYCMEYMDAGSLDKLQGVGVPEDVLGRIASSMVQGLKYLKDNLQIIHRDVKPTNVLLNKKGEVKLCDFGVSGQLEKSLAKTNIGCQSYMAPERIKGESQNNLGTYTVASDVWSLGLSVIEVGMGKYPYPPETYSNVFAQLTAIVHGDPPELPGDKYSEVARSWVAHCMVKAPEGRATYKDLLEHPFLVADANREVDMVGWVAKAVEYRDQQAAHVRSSSRYV